MPAAKASPLKLDSLADLVEQVADTQGFAELVRSLQSGRHGAIDGAWGSSCALAAAAIATSAPATTLIVLPRIADVDDFAVDLQSFLPDEPDPVVFPAWETLPSEHQVADAVFGGRLRVLRELAGNNPPPLIVSSIAALLQPVPSREERERGTRTLSVNQEIDRDELAEWLSERGFARVPALEMPGEFAMHGGIIDLFPPDAVDPYRIELFGDEIESIRTFDVESQRKIDDLPQAEIAALEPVPADATIEGNAVASGGEHLLDVVPDDTWVVLSELADVVDEGRSYLERLGSPAGMFSVPATLSRCAKRPMVTAAAIGAEPEPPVCKLPVETISRFTGPRAEVLDELAQSLDAGDRVLLACHNEGEQERLAELIAESQPDLLGRVRLCVGRLTRGFRLRDTRTVVLSDHELFGRTEVRRAKRRKKRVESRAIDTFLDLKVGDLVVHLTNGIGRYRGMDLLDKDGRKEEHLAIEFRDGIRVYVPVSLIHLVQKYVGAAKGAPQLSKLGGATWAKKKAKVSEAVTDMASDMLRLQAAREASEGLSCPPDSHLQVEFEASFPYVETQDQLDAIRESKHDLELLRPMDRLICGDVGFGKTEVAMRAAFKVVDAGRQVAVLVPTTVLAEQHFRTFSDRMAEYPIVIDSLSRFKTKGEQREIVNAMERGAVDIVIGTHRLVQQDIRFKDLGLLIIDEEQRFGVDAKEMLKRLRLSVDVLTLSATPIPRTLHLSLLGIRDISNLTTPPQDRVAIETRIVNWDRELIRQAVVRELNRGGQVYFVHNRVYNIEEIADQLQSIVPEARIGIVHGQMNEHRLEQNMLDFVAGKLDVLVATTIIESGLDIPNANTIFIHQADNIGLADLHQLRGRVGRYRHRAFCYLVLGERKRLPTTAFKRLKAIEEYSELGAGFKIAMRDLEIRGAGNILGTEQSGHIGAVGYELYCQLLENAVRRLRNEPERRHPHVNLDLPVEAYLPAEYVPPGRVKIEVYRKLFNTTTRAELAEVTDEIRDRFGPLPREAERLVELKDLGLAAFTWGIDTVRLEDGYAVFQWRANERVGELRGRLGSDLRIVDPHTTYLVLADDAVSGDPLVEYLRSVLQ